jgi:hypothetical protein
MEPQFKTSFIPKKPDAGAEVRRSRGGPVGLLFVLSFIVFVIALLLTVGLFFYQESLRGGIERRTADLDQARQAFETELFQEIIQLDNRLKTADQLLEQHVAVSRFFDFLEENTLQAVQFTSLEYTALPDGNISIALEGRAQSFSTLALQSDVFNTTNILRNALFADLNVDQLGDVIFSLTATIDKQHLAYRPTTESTFEGSFPVETETATTSTTTESANESANIDNL